ncbi:hypothetical protein HKX48_001130 [Thoreauomyces humboldtii]|nr:hypothetical protein HKX48_001130 [Thoreauomyces humboldtii]
MDDDDIDNMDFDLPTEVMQAVSSSSQSNPHRQAQQQSASGLMAAPGTEVDPRLREEMKSWTVVYPIYISSNGRRHRKIPLGMCPTARPSAIFIAECLRFLQLNGDMDPNKRHPADPLTFGRVRVQLFDPATRRPMNSKITTKRQLLKEIAALYPTVEERLLKADRNMADMVAASLSAITLQEDTTKDGPPPNPAGKGKEAVGSIKAPKKKGKKK